MRKNNHAATTTAAEDESFDYKDFNFIVGKQKSNQLSA